MNRVPPTEVRRKLRCEAGYGCPVPNCGKPYLEWHHFDPPWRVKQHHDPIGMIALCPEHHRKADSGAFTKEQLYQFKRNANRVDNEVKGKFDWLRNNLLAIVGGNFYYLTLKILVVRDQPIIWFNRDDNGNLLLNVRMLTTSNEDRALIEDNFWIKRGNPTDLESPPSGKLLRIAYGNGDYLRIEFFELATIQDVIKKYPDADPQQWRVMFPITAVEIQYKIANTPIEFGPRWTKLPGSMWKNAYFRGCAVAIALD
jgi:hypothetical protein